MDFLNCPSDLSFGPGVRGCRDDFDFTFKFQKIIFSILPASVLIASSAPRLVALIRRKRIVHGAWFQYTKLVPYITAAVLKIGLLVLSTNASRLADFFVASAVLECAAMLCMAVVSFYEHSRTPRPSIMLGLYLALTMLFDIAQTRSLWLAGRSENDARYAKLFTVTAVLRFIMLLLESVRKERWLQWDSQKHSPEESVGILELSTFSWTYRLLFLGNKKILDMSDLYTLDSNMTVSALHKHVLKLRQTDFKGKKNALAKLLSRSLAVYLLLPVAPRVASLVFMISKPLLIESLLEYLSQGESRSANTGYGLIAATILIYAGEAVTMGLYTYYHQRSLFIGRSVLVDAIYRKTTTAKSASSDNEQSLTLMGTDVERIRMGFMSLHDLWAVPVQIAVSCFLLYRQLGAAFAAPIVLVGVCVGLSTLAMRYIRGRQTLWMEKVEKRVGKTSNAIANMKNIKISGLASAIESAIQKMRVDEIKIGTQFRVLSLILIAFGFSPQTLSPAFTFAVTSRSINVSSVFTSAALLSQMAIPLNSLFQMAPKFLAALACVQRVQKFLEKDDRRDFRQLPSQRHEPDAEKNIHESDRVESESDAPCIPRAAEIHAGQFGWESDKMILKNVNMSIVQGLNIVVGPVASGKSTLCKALLGEIPFAEGTTSISVRSESIGFCDQVAFLHNGTVKENIVGFTKFDETRYAEVVEAAMLNQDLSIFPHGDQTSIGSNGVALSGGQKQRVSIARSLYKDCELYIFDDILSGLDTDTEKHVFSRIFGYKGLLKRRNATVVLCTHAVHHLPLADHVIALSTDGTVAEQGTYAEVIANKQYVHSLGVQDNAERRKDEFATSLPGSEAETAAAPKSVRPKYQQEREDLARKTGDTKVFAHYFKSIGVPWMIAFLFAGLMSGFLWNFPNIWLKFWAEDAALKNRKHSNAFFTGVYAMLQCSSLISIIIEIAIGYLVVTKLSGTKLHQYAIRTVTAAPLRFFATTDVGVITTLFSQDMTLLDEELPGALLDVVAMIWIVLGSAAIAATASPYVVISYPFIFTMAYYLQKFYLRTSRQLRLLELEAKSPLYTNFIDTMKGIVTYRAFGWTQDAIIQNNIFLDASTSPAYLLAIIQRWLLLNLGFLMAVVAILVVTLATQLNADSGLTGAGMVAIIAFGGFLNSLILNYVELETSIGAVNRLKSFSATTEVEDLPGEDVVPPISWPEKGKIEIKNASASYAYSPRLHEDYAEKYDETFSLALRNLTLTIEAGEKVAVCGRTGSGKSSVVLLLLRLLDPMPSNDFALSIDDMPLKSIDRNTVRQRLIAVPQDPVFLPDGTTFMMNLDPSQVSTEAECQASLEAVELWNFVVERGGLQGSLSADLFSQGQKQLFSLARAILRRRVRHRQLSENVGHLYLEGAAFEKSNDKSVITEETRPTECGGGGILILDEYSSSLDHATDRMMQEIIRKEFEEYTVVMVSHRLEMVMGFDKVVVLDAGSVVENGVPSELVNQEGSWFRYLWLARKSE